MVREKLVLVVRTAKTSAISTGIRQFPGHLSRLLGHLILVRMCRTPCKIDLACAMLDEKQAVQGLQRQRFDGKEIARQELLLVVTALAQILVPFPVVIMRPILPN